jgi:transcriptional regulator with XRE-family HTH domain
VDEADRILADLGRRVAELRRERGWTQEVLANRLGMQVQSLQKIERGAANLTVRTIVRVARGLTTSHVDLFVPPTTRSKRRPGRPSKS